MSCKESQRFVRYILIETIDTVLNVYLIYLMKLLMHQDEAKSKYRPLRENIKYEARKVTPMERTLVLTNPNWAFINWSNLYSRVH